jgi:hypothetical protein
LAVDPAKNNSATQRFSIFVYHFYDIPFHH